MNVSSNGEIFSSKERRSNISSITKTLDKVYNLDWNSSASKNECTAAVGLKWMLNQVRRRVKSRLTFCFFFNSPSLPFLEVCYFFLLDKQKYTPSKLNIRPHFTQFMKLWNSFMWPCSVQLYLNDHDWARISSSTVGCC